MTERGCGRFGPVEEFPEATYCAILTHHSLPRPIIRDEVVLRRGFQVEVEMK